MIRHILVIIAAISFGNGFASDSEEDSWRTEANVVAQCKDTSRVTKFLKKAVADSFRADRAEENITVIDDLAMEHPSCFLRAISHLDKATCIEVLDHFVNAAEMHDQKKIDDSLRSVKHPAHSCYSN